MSRSRRWLLATLVAVCLVAAGCNQSDKDGADGGDDNVVLPDDIDSNGDGRPDGPDGTGGETTTTGGGNFGRPSTTQPGGTPPPTNSNQGPTPTFNAADPYAAARHNAGDYARTLLRPQPAAKLVFEVLHQPGAAPSANTVDHAVRVLREVSGKNVVLQGPTQIPDGGDAVNERQIEAMSDQHGKAKQGNGQAVIRILFLNGAFNGDESFLGVALRGDTAAVMYEQVRASSSPLVPRSVLEDAVTHHEMGHLLGLVDIALKTGRADKDHPGHSTNRNSVMYWAIESDVVSQVLGGPPPVDFDSADRADLAALRNGA